MDYKKIFDLILDENDFTVGGGSSSAIVGAMACGLMGMVANLSKGKDYGYSDKEYDNIIKELNKAKANFLQGAVDDNKAYMLIVNAYKLPKSSEEEKEIRRKAIQNAGIEAAKVPLSNALLNKKVNDLQAGVDLSHIGINMGKSNVKANLPLIKDEKIVKNFKKEIENL